VLCSSLELNPENQNAKERLEVLKGQEEPQWSDRTFDTSEVPYSVYSQLLKAPGSRQALPSHG
jgi:hypothetical protein